MSSYKQQAEIADPREIGGRYYSGYWNKEYTVTGLDAGWIMAEWEDGEITEHYTAWDAKRDRIVAEKGAE